MEKKKKRKNQGHKVVHKQKFKAMNGLGIPVEKVYANSNAISANEVSLCPYRRGIMVQLSRQKSEIFIMN